ncbi:glycosyltransferase family protein [Singulisphaera acidiphila]|uniref:Uncharacterized protein n=1 Tax=Singulisphaera acidiphila (strain ATCC BAA-1392 / DSM 18658 / VKM B-2454 / MOB10) TaxID=886293 RepID=L0DFS6_SINAD|nr:hypothetical protein [Singulisphaera acidiphila]AGA27673.1 hypothetical protein Sinac_3412 [Singulisphaera acidiphila DSM 18658]
MLNNIACHYRFQIQGEGGTEIAECLLLREITGVADSKLCQVSRDACLYCCRQGEPSVDRVNPVVGSLLFGLATEILGQEGVAGCDVDKARRIRAWSEDFLDTDPDEVDDSRRPERVDLACYYLGDKLEVRTLAATDPLTHEPIFRCHHPAHVETTREGCIRCRDWSDQPRPAALPISAWLPAPAQRTGRPVQRWAVGLTTSPRRRPTLEWTLDSLVRAGWDQARLFVDAAVTIPRRYAHLPVTQREPKSGAWPNFYLGLAELLMRDPDADAYMMIQDDATFYDRINLREYLESILWPSDPPPPISLYSCQLDVAAQAGWHPHNKPWFRGALALVFHPSTARRFLVDPIVFGHRWNPRNDGLAHVDTVVGDWAYRNGTPIQHPTPSLCRHIGYTSTLWFDAKVEHDRIEGPFGDEVLHSPSGSLHRGAFPEAAFPCPEPIAEAYHQTIERGRERMRQHSVTICGIGRDIARTFPEFAARVERLGAMFRTYHALFYENDSEDRTPALLNAWAEANPAIRVVCERHGDPRFGSIRSLVRTAALAAYRNRCREVILSEFADDDYVIVVDMDLEGGWSEDGIAHTFGHDHWDFVGSYGLRHDAAHSRDRERKPIHLDTWAYRIPGNEDPLPGPQAQALALQRGDRLQPVWSCFGGLGVYRMECLKAADYGGDDCEHVVLHRRLRQLGFDRLFLNPNQIVLYKALRSTPSSNSRPE